MKTRLSKSLIRVISAILIVVAIIICLFNYEIQAENASVKEVGFSQDELQQIENIQYLMQEFESGTRGYLLTNQPEFLQPYLQAADSLPKAISRLERLISHDSIQRKHYASLLQFVNLKSKFTTQTIEIRETKGVEAALLHVSSGFGKRYMDSIRAVVKQMQAHESKILAAQNEKRHEASFYARIILIAPIVVFLFLLLFLVRQLGRDVTKRRQIEEALMASNERFKLVSKATYDAIWDWDIASNKVQWDENFELIIGYKPEKDTGDISMWDKLLHPADRERTHAALDALLRSKETNWEYEYRYVKPDGSFVHVLDKAVVLRNDKGRPYRMIGSMRDVTEKRNAELKEMQLHKHIQLLLDSTSEGLYGIDKTGACTFINKAGAAMLGYDPADCIGKNMHLLIHYKHKNGDHFPEEECSIYISIINNKSCIEDSEVFWKADGSPLFVQYASNPILENGEQMGAVINFSDITERKEAEEAIQFANAEKEEFQYRFQAILDNSPQAVLIKDIEGRYLFSNKMFFEIFDIDPINIIGKKPGDIISDKALVAVLDAADEMVLRERKVTEYSQRLLKRNGAINHAQIIKFPLYNRHQQLFGIGTICKDITELVQYQEELIASREKAIQAERLQEEFLANMSHELRTPMNGIIGMSNVLINTPLQPKQREHLHIIQQSSTTLLNLLNDILDLSKIKAGMINLEKVDFDFNETIAGTASAFKQRTTEKGIRLLVQAEPYIPRNLSGDPHRLIQILNNLLSNAIKFTDKGFVKLEAYLKSNDEEKAVVEFVVSDSGIGIEESELEGIFNNFSQASSDISRKYGGTGLGLPITKRLIELQGGEISVESTLGKGSIFTFCIPYGISDSAAVPVLQQNFSKTAAAIKKDFSGKHVLIVEDTEINQVVSAATLKQYNITYAIANNGQEAIEMLESGELFDMIFMDLRMPVMNGFQATAYIRQKMQMDVPVVILTASVLRNERERCLSMGASDYMSKPFNPSDLERCLEKYLKVDQLVKTGKKNLNDPEIDTELPNEFDVTKLLELEDEDSIRHVLNLFTEKIPIQLNELKEVVARKNWSEFLEKTHKCRGSLSIIQIPEVYNLILLAEEIVTHKNDYALLPSMLEKSIELFESLVPNICKEVDEQIEIINTNTYSI